MGKIIKYEFQKLIRNRTYIIIAMLLIVTNLFSIYIHEKDESAFLYVYEEKEQYQNYLQGNIVEETYYQWIDEQQAEYLKSYPVFLGEMENRAETLTKLSTYSEMESFVYRNIQKTCSDYQKLSGLEVTAGADYGIKQFAGYNWGILYLISFLVITGYFLLSAERNKGLFLLMKSTKNGHFKFPLAKYFVFVILSLVYEMMQELSTIVVMGHFYGYGELNRQIQSISEFRNCIYRLTIKEYMIATILSRILIAFVLASVIYVLYIAIKNEFLLLIAIGSSIGLEIILNMIVLETEKWSILKCVNIFYCWDSVQLFGNYLNLNILQHPIRKEFVASAIEGMIVVGSIMVGVQIFHKSYQISSGSYGERFLLKIREKTAIIWQHMGLGVFEFYKVCVQQKKGIIFLFMLILFGIEISDLNNANIYYSAKEATYHSIINKMEGELSEESLKILEEEEQYIEYLYQELGNKSNYESENDEIMRKYWASELELKEEGVQMVTDQIEKLYQDEGDIYQKYVVDEIDYYNLWSDFRTDIIRWFLGVIGVILWCSSIYTVEEKKKLYPLLRTMKKGRMTLNNQKNICALVGTVSMFGLMGTLDFIEYFSIDGFKCLQHKLSDFAMINLERDWKLGTLLLVVFILKAISYLIPMLLCIVLSRILKSEMMTSIIMCGSITAIFIVFYYLEIDITRVVLGLI